MYCYTACSITVLYLTNCYTVIYKALCCLYHPAVCHKAALCPQCGEFKCQKKIKNLPSLNSFSVWQKKKRSLKDVFIRITKTREEFLSWRQKH